MDDIQTIRAALTLARRIAAPHRYGGMGGLWKLAHSALEALDRLEHTPTGAQWTQLPLHLDARGLQEDAERLRLQALALDTQAARLEDRASAWLYATLPQPVPVSPDGDGC